VTTPVKFLNLRELMRQFDVSFIASTLNHISESIEKIKPYATTDGRDDRVPSDGIEVWARPHLTSLQILAEQIDLVATRQRVWEGGGSFYFAVHAGMTWQELYNELKVLQQTVYSDLESRIFVFVPPERVKVHNELQAAFRPVGDTFPDAIVDIEEMLYCYLLERHTATVFHLMNVLEWRLRSLCFYLGIKKVKNFIKKTGKTELVPIEFNVWEKLINQCRTRVNAKINKLQRGTAKQKWQEFLPILQDIEDVKDAWRNHTMHGRKTYNAEEAEAAISHVKPIMVALTARKITKL
jgi:hypothetical protein